MDPFTELNIKYVRALDYIKVLESRIAQLESNRSEREKDLVNTAISLEKKLKKCDCAKKVHSL